MVRWLIGGYFAGHPAVQEATLEVLDHEHSSTAHLSAKWTKRDEWYDFKDLNDEVNVLINVDEATDEGGNMGNSHPVSWYHEFDGGRAFIGLWDILRNPFLVRFSLSMCWVGSNM